MKYSLLKRISAFVLAFALVFTTAFNTTVGANAAAKGKVTGIAVKSAKVTVTVGAKKTVKVKVTAKNGKKAVKTAAFGKITAKSSNKKVATVTRKNGKSGGFNSSVIIKGVKAGKATITVTTVKKNAKNKKISKKITVTVKAKATTAAPASTEAPTTASSEATTALPADVKTEKVTLDKTTASVVEGETITLIATKTPAATVDKIVWSSSNTKIATVSGDGVVTGVSEGSATITAKAGDAFATATITVTKKEIVANVVEVKQTASNGFTVTFDNASANAVVNKTTLVVEAADKSLVLPVTGIEWSKDGLSAKVTTSVAFGDKKEYTVSYKNSSKTFIASVGKMASIAILTTTAQQNVSTPIKYALYDAAGMDITPTANLSGLIQSITVEGDDVTPDTGDVTKASLVMATVGKVATVTITYNSGATDEKDQQFTGNILCVEPTALVGTGVWYAGDDNTNKNIECARFYNGISSTSGKVVENGTLTLYFYAKGDNGEALAYDSYAVTSSNDDVLSVALDSTEKTKFAKVTVTGITGGSGANVNITATKNGKETPYTFPVSVTKKGVMTTFTATPSMSTMSNAYETEYVGSFKCVGKDAYGNELTAGEDYTVTFEPVKDYTGDVVDALKTAQNAGFKVAANGDYTAMGAASSSYQIKVVATNSEGKEFPSTKTINIQKLPAPTWTGAGNDMSYQVQIGAKTIDQTSGTSSSTKARLAAFAGSYFAGYVNGDGSIGDGKMTDSRGLASANGMQVTVPAEPFFGGLTIALVSGNASSVAYARSTRTLTINASGNALQASNLPISANAVAAFDLIAGSGDASADGLTATDWNNVNIKAAPATTASAAVTGLGFGKYAHATLKTALGAVSYNIQKGKYYYLTGYLYTAETNTDKANGDALGAAADEVVIASRAANFANHEFDPTGAVGNGYFAPNATYTLNYFGNFAYGTRAAFSKTGTVTAKSGMVAPKVSVDSRNPSSTALDDIAKCISTNVDLNNSTETSSIGAITLNAKAKNTDTSATISSVQVTETIGSDKFLYKVPTTATFTVKS